MNTVENFKKLESELAPYKKLLGSATDTILNEDVSAYPIFVAYQIPEVNIGIPLVNRAETGKAWSINASSLEEFVTKQIIEAEKKDDFVHIYKDPLKYLCVFVVSDFGATFVFVPRN